MVDEDNRFRFYLHRNGWQTVAARTVPGPGEWTHVAVTLDAGETEIYVNGVREGSKHLGGAIPDTAAPLTIGGIKDGARLRQMLFGAVDDVRLSRRVLTGEEVKTMAGRETTPHVVPKDADRRFELWKGAPLPTAADVPLLSGVRFHTIKLREPEVDGYNWLHGVALVWHNHKLYASFGHNKGSENTASEEARSCVSSDGGATWADVVTIDPGKGNLAASHGVFLSRQCVAAPTRRSASASRCAHMLAPTYDDAMLA